MVEGPLFEASRILASSSAAFLAFMAPLTAALVSYKARERKLLAQRLRDTDEDTTRQIARLNDNLQGSPVEQLLVIRKRIRKLEARRRKARIGLLAGSSIVTIMAPIAALAFSLGVFTMLSSLAGQLPRGLEMSLFSVASATLLTALGLTASALLSTYRQACEEARLGPVLVVEFDSETLPTTLEFDREYRLKVCVTNIGDSVARSTSLTVIAPDGVELAKGKQMARSSVVTPAGRMRQKAQYATINPREYNVLQVPFLVAEEAGELVEIHARAYCERYNAPTATILLQVTQAQEENETA